MADDEELVPDGSEDYEDYITLDYDDGSAERCAVIGYFTVEGWEYVALAPEKDEESVYLYRNIDYPDGTFELRDIEDDEEFATVSAVYEQLMEDEQD